MVDLLTTNKRNLFAEELLLVINESEIDFHTTNPGSLKKEDLIHSYSNKLKNQKNGLTKNEFTEGYEELLFALSETSDTMLTMTIIDSEAGAYTVISITDTETLIRIVKSNITLTEIRKRYAAYKSIIGKNDNDKAITFIKGNLKG